MKELLFTFLVAILSSPSYGQFNVASSEVVDLGVSVFGSGMGVRLGMGYAFSREALVTISAGSILGQHKSVVYNPYYLEGRAVYSLVNSTRGKSAMVSGVGAVVMQYDRLVSNGFELKEGDSASSWNVGFGLGLEISFLLNRSFSAYLNGVQKYFVKRDFGHWRYEIGIGVRKTI